MPRRRPRARGHCRRWGRARGGDIRVRVVLPGARALHTRVCRARGCAEPLGRSGRRRGRTDSGGPGAHPRVLRAAGRRVGGPLPGRRARLRPRGRRARAAAGCDGPRRGLRHRPGVARARVPSGRRDAWSPSTSPPRCSARPAGSVGTGSRCWSRRTSSRCRGPGVAGRGARRRPALAPARPGRGAGRARAGLPARARLALFHPVGRAALARRHGRELDPDDVRAEGTVRRLLAAAGWRCTAVDDAPDRWLVLAERR